MHSLPTCLAKKEKIGPNGILILKPVAVKDGQKCHIGDWIACTTVLSFAGPCSVTRQLRQAK